ncbi:hypothetical protein [Merismopedia glauca]|uniref:GNAT family N-acetyltransferase n=1 Tax=Merismopedia glauca CCAP 1448/3 TaxID=1296344 RepID=A0A2T1C6M9_9CYAN|nr:hypothetical protein [Merismopedia glauca]PSB03896.1 hypothetical protein C7B64_06300 [Merismopedia glauca CCAP 1448/3]
MKARIVASTDLTLPEREAMYGLLNQHFMGVKRDIFNADLAEKNWVILIEQELTNTLKGFSTILIYTTQLAGELMTVVYSGDTIMDPSSWSSSILSRAWIGAIKTLRLQYPQGKFYWLLICSGYRTYRFLPTFWQEFYPRYDVSTPPKVTELMQFLAQDLFGDRYQRETGIVRLIHPQLLAGKLQGIPLARLADPHINFFGDRNPDHAQGDELVCLTEIGEDNLTSAGRRMWFAKNNTLAASF